MPNRCRRPARRYRRPKKRPRRPGFIEGVKTKFRERLVRGLAGPAAAAGLRGRPHRAGPRATTPTCSPSSRPSSSTSARTCRWPASGSSSSRTWSSTAATRSSTPTRGSSTPSSNCARRRGRRRSSSPRGRGTGGTSSSSSRRAASGAVLRKHGVRFVDLNHDEPVKAPNLGRLTGLDSPVPDAHGDVGRRVHLAAEAEDAPLGRGDAVAQEPVRHAAGHLLRLAEERAALAGHPEQHRGHRPDADAAPGDRGRRSSAWRATARSTARPGTSGRSSWASTWSPWMRPAAG